MIEQAKKHVLIDVAVALRIACVDDINGSAKYLEQAQLLKLNLPFHTEKLMFT